MKNFVNQFLPIREFLFETTDFLLLFEDFKAMVVGVRQDVIC